MALSRCLNCIRESAACKQQLSSFLWRKTVADAAHLFNNALNAT
jgi:hypothetical protein